MGKARILLVEDEQELAEMLIYNLESENYDVAVTHSGDEVDMLIDEAKPNLILLDWMLPGISGIEICRRLRMRQSTKNIPIIMITARGEVTERLRGFETGADDYMVKPFSVQEMMARINSLLRRSAPELFSDQLILGNIKLDRLSQRAYRNDKELKLGPIEFKLLEFLMQRPGRVYSREQLLDFVWGQDVYVEDRTVDVHVGRLRRTLNRGRAIDPIRTVRGRGYAFDENFTE